MIVNGIDFGKYRQPCVVYFKDKILYATKHKNIGFMRKLSNEMNLNKECIELCKCKGEKIKIYNIITKEHEEGVACYEHRQLKWKK